MCCGLRGAFRDLASCRYFLLGCQVLYEILLPAATSCWTACSSVTPPSHIHPISFLTLSP